jgi:hypothetical protein
LAQRAPVGGSDGGELISKLLVRAPVFLIVTVPVAPLHPEVRMAPETTTLQGVVMGRLEEELQVTPVPETMLVWVRLPTAKALPLFWV